MKTLFLLRHAKSGWDNPELKDFERPLNERGLKDAPAMGKRLANEGRTIDCIVSSPAVRARTTAKLIAREIGYPDDNIISNPELYFAGVGMFVKAAATADEDCESVLLVGHNPAITDFANALANINIDNIPTCGLVEFSLPIDDWSQLELGIAKMTKFDFPKNF